MSDTPADDKVVKLSNVTDVVGAMDRRGEARLAVEHLGNYRDMIRAKNQGFGEPCIRVPLDALNIVRPSADGCAYLSLANIIAAIERHRDGL